MQFNISRCGFNTVTSSAAGSPAEPIRLCAFYTKRQGVIFRPWTGCVKGADDNESCYSDVENRATAPHEKNEHFARVSASNWHGMKGTFMQREMTCGVFPIVQFKLDKKAPHARSSSRIQWKRWNTLMPMKVYDLTYKSMAMNICSTNLKEMGRVFC